MSQDPVGFHGGINTYAYASNDPVNLTDPFGFAPVIAGPGIAGPTAAAAGTGAVATLTIAETAPPAFTLIAGGSAEAGLAGGPVGVAVFGAGVAGWGTGRAIGHIPIGHGQTIDDGMQLIFNLTLFGPPASNGLPAVQSSPTRRSSPLGGRKSGSGNDDDCMNRFLDEKAFCSQYYESKDLYRMCMDRAFWRFNNCKKNVPDPGPLDPLDPDFSIN
jgi:hypothetical protein